MNIRIYIDLMNLYSFFCLTIQIYRENEEKIFILPLMRVKDRVYYVFILKRFRSTHWLEILRVLTFIFMDSSNVELKCLRKEIDNISSQ